MDPVRTLEPPAEAVRAARERGDVAETLRAFVVWTAPRLTLIPGFLADAEIDHLLGLAEAAGAWVPSVVWRGGDTAYRTSESFMLRTAQTPVVEAIELRVAAVAGVPVEQVERLNIVRYSPGQFYGSHHDGRNRPKTVFVYLNDVEEGGETRFPNAGVQVRPIRGCAAMWDNLDEEGGMDWATSHEGVPPRRGMKYAMNCFICKTRRGAPNEWPGQENTGNLMEEWWSRSSVGVREIRELSLRKLAAAHLSPAEMALALGQAGAEEAGEARGISLVEICESPWFGVVPVFLEPDEVAHLVAAAAALPADCWRPAAEDPTRGSSSVAALRDVSAAYAEVVAERLAALLDAEPSCVEPPAVERLGPGQFVFERHPGLGRSHSAIVYLTSVDAACEDGVTDFKHTTFQFRPDLAGAALVWRNIDPQGRIDDRLKQTEMPLAGMTRYLLTCHVARPVDA